MRELAVVGQTNSPILRIDRRHLAEAREHSATGERSIGSAPNVAWRQSGGGHLIQQRLKKMVIVAVEERDIDRRIPQCFRRRQAAEPTADDKDMRS